MAGTAELALRVALALAVCGTLISLASLGSIQRFCFDNEGSQGLTNCPTYLIIYWVATALQAFLLVCVGVAAATRAIHTYRSSLYTQGAVAVAISLVQGSIAFRFTAALPAGTAYDRWCAYLAGVCVYVAADLALAFVGDAVYQERRVQGAKGFVTFKKRLPANWQAKAEAAQAEAAAEDAAADAGPLRSAFLAALALALAGACIALGGTAAVQSFCSAEGYVVYGSGFKWQPCNEYWSLWWFTWALVLAFLGATAWCFAAKQIHTYRASLWSLAAVTCAVSCYLLFQLYAPLDYVTGTLRTRYQATLAGFAIYTGAAFLLMVLGDMLYRVKRVLQEDGFVTFKRPALWTPEDEALAAAAPAAKQPLRPAEWAFFASAALAVAGTCIALGGLAAAQATCNQGGQQRNFMGVQEDCGSFLSWPWFGWALQVAVLAGLAWSWATNNIHNFKLSIWAVGSVVILTAIYTAQKLFTMQPYSTGALHERQVAALWGFAIIITADYLMAICLDAVHTLKREEGADGFVTFRRPNWPQRSVTAAPEAAAV